MSRDRGTQTSTTTTAPPAFLQPALRTAANQAVSQFMGGGTPVVGFSADTNRALQLAKQRALHGSPVTNAAQNFALQTLGGGFMGQNPALSAGNPFVFEDRPNPFLQDTFNQAAQAVTNQVQSNFARAGRNVRGRDAAGVATGRLQDLAADIFGGAFENEANRRFSAAESALGRQFNAFENERARQQQLIPLAPLLAQQDFADIAQLANVGAIRDDLRREIASAPGRNLDQLIGRLGLLGGGFGVTTQQVPFERNRLAGGLGGALAGAQLGSVFPGIGTAVGAGIGGLIGVL